MTENALVVIGNFDGVHRGHQAVLSSVREKATEGGLAPKLLTFHPHPAVTLGRQPPALLTTLERKRELVERACPGIEMVVERFDRDFAEQSPEQFVERVLARRLRARVVLVGENFRFGRRRAGSIDDLRRLGERWGFEAQIATLVGDDAGVWSSTRARAALAGGDLAAVTDILGRPHMVSGRVVRGDQRGRTIGFPTCNLAEVDEALPPQGVYAVAVDRDEPARALATGVANLGVRPTVEGVEPRLEVHLFDLDENLYGAALRVHLLARLREERRFDGLEALKAQIARDAEKARRRLRGLRPGPSGAFF
jgi:riboflavin kinase / FMN adenylyltransferase